MTKPATMAIRAFAIRKARRYLQRDGEWLTEEATDDILDTIEESFGLRYCERSGERLRHAKLLLQEARR